MWPETPLPIALAIALVCTVGYMAANNVDLPRYPKWGYPQWVAIPVFVVSLLVSFTLVAWIQGLGAK